MQAHKSDLRYLLVFLCLLTSACASRTPISEVTLDGSQAVRVPFLTNRDLENNRDGEQYFGNGRGTLGAGSCSVYLEAPEKLRGKARVLAVNQEADAALPVAADDRLVLYVHGYNIGFEKGCRRSARLTENAGLHGQLLLFSWPADGNYLNYVGDVADMGWSIADLEQVLLRLAAADLQVDLIGHSLGARGLVEALGNLSRSNATEVTFGHLVLSAPDVDRDVFEQNLEFLLPMVSDVTIYISSKDRALAMSGQLHGYRRLGQVGLTEPVAGVDVVDVASEVRVREVSGHLYHLYNPAVVEDLRHVLGTATGERQFERKAAGSIWRLTDAVDQ